MLSKIIIEIVILKITKGKLGVRAVALKTKLKEIIPEGLIEARRALLYKNIFLASTYKDKYTEYQNIINQRLNYSFTDIEKLAADIPIKLFTDIFGNYNEYNYYGDFQILLDYTGVKFYYPNGDFTIQHGFRFPDSYIDEYFRGLKKYLCWGEVEENCRKKIINTNGEEINIKPIGAPFFYAKSLLTDEEIISEKKRLGKNLLVFPSHSTHYNITSFNIAEFLSKLDIQRKKFDTVRICLYWKDIMTGKHIPYIANGYECVCCGHIFDLNFLRRLKSLIEISDCTYSNMIGSHIPYSLYCDKPHFLEVSDIEYSYLHDSWGNEIYDKVKKLTDYQKIQKVFCSNGNYKITEEQISVLEPYAGFSYKKSPKELYKIIME